MARRRLPDRPPNGIGAGERPQLKPRSLNVEAAHEKLTQPFKVPFKRAPPADPAHQQLRNPIRSARKRVKTYAYADPAAESSDTLSLDDADYSSQPQLARSSKRVDALSARRLLQDPARLDQIGSVLRRSFTVPIRGYVPRHNMPLSLGTKPKIVMEPRPLHDPTDEFAIVLYDPSVDGEMPQDDLSPASSSQASPEPTQLHPQGSQAAPSASQAPRMLSNGVPNKTLRELLGDPREEKKFPSVPVVIDPKLAKVLRPHQVEGVRFLYRCVTGLVMKDFLDAQAVLEGSQPTSTEKSAADEAVTAAMESCKQTPEANRGAYGCIMADEMGLGKTLQCIALMWTLLRQGPHGKRTIGKCIIVCPSSLVNNWANEITKWLGKGVLAALAVDGKKSSLNNGTVAEAVRSWAIAQGRNIVKPVMIISYETLRRNVEHLRNCDVGLLLADEGHRLKNADSLTFTSLNSINCPRRVILSGTPIQNDLSEYFSLLNFSNPGLLGTRAQFRKNFELPILRGRDAEAEDDEIREGELKLQQLSNVVSKFIIRRTNDILSKYLPCKYEHVIFVNLSPFQRAVYQLFVSTREVKKIVKSQGGQQILKAIGLLKKLCNHPDLIELPADVDGSQDLIPEDYRNSNHAKRGSSEVQTWHSGKFSILQRFLHSIKANSNDKIVIISNYTQTLDLIERMCRNNRYGVLRLDGTMTINKRQKLVDKFNDPEGQEFIFLLSSKAGGCGINLIGANRLILMDPDWNPAADQQALARVWRDGQKKDCFIYRFISTGTIEEKIYQRQSMKMSLSSCVVDEKEDVERLYSADNLRQLFQYNSETICDTHDTYSCKRCKNGKQILKSQAMLYGDTTTWNHLDHHALIKTNDHLLRTENQFNDISYVFQYISH